MPRRDAVPGVPRRNAAPGAPRRDAEPGRPLRSRPAIESSRSCLAILPPAQQGAGGDRHNLGIAYSQFPTKVLILSEYAQLMKTSLHYILKAVAAASIAMIPLLAVSCGEDGKSENTPVIQNTNGIREDGECHSPRQDTWPRQRDMELCEEALQNQVRREGLRLRIPGQQGLGPAGALLRQVSPPRDFHAHHQ